MFAVCTTQRFGGVLTVPKITIVRLFIQFNPACLVFFTCCVHKDSKGSSALLLLSVRCVAVERVQPRAAAPSAAWSVNCTISAPASFCSRIYMKVLEAQMALSRCARWVKIYQVGDAFVNPQHPK